MTLMYAHNAGIIDNEELLLLFDLNTSNNPDLTYMNYPEFSLGHMSDNECKTELRFLSRDIDDLANVLEIPEEVTVYNECKVDGNEAFCIFFKRFVYPCRYLDMIPRFGRPVPQLCMISNHIMDFLYTRWNYLLSDMTQP